MGVGVQILAQVGKRLSPEKAEPFAIRCATPGIGESMVTTQARYHLPLGYTA
jgi:hypothetical protein